jgi:hypothetical protein
MKSAEEFVYENNGFTILRNDHASIEKVQELLHDAFKAGMLEAAEIVTKEIDYCAAPSSHEDMASAHKAILTAANNLKKEGM